MNPVRHRLSGGMNLAEALSQMQNNQVEALPVVESSENEKLLGVLDLRDVRRKVNAELVSRKTVQPL